MGFSASEWQLEEYYVMSLGKGNTVDQFCFGGSQLFVVVTLE